MMHYKVLSTRAVSWGRGTLNRIRYGGPTGAVKNLQYAADFPSRWHTGFDSSMPMRERPTRFGDCEAHFDLIGDPYPPLGVLEVPQGPVVGESGWVFTHDGKLLIDCTWYNSSDEVRLPFTFGRPRKLRGTCLSLVSDFSHGNYGHFVLDCLTRFGIFQAAGFDIASIDCIYLPEPSSPSARTIMRELGIPEEKCIWARPSQIICADQLITTSFPGRRRDYPYWIPLFLQQTIKSSVTPSHRIYVPRTGVRRPSNELELIEIANRFGFEAFDFRNCDHEPSFFNAAEAVIGAHGAGLTNIGFCQPGTKVLELIPSDHVHPYFYTLADSAGLDYSYLIGTSSHSRPPGTFGPSPYDFEIDPHAFERALKILF